MWGPAVKQTAGEVPASGMLSSGDGQRSLAPPDQTGVRRSSVPEAALDARRCALAVAQFPEGRTLAADEADPAAVLLPLGQTLTLTLGQRRTLRLPRRLTILARSCRRLQWPAFSCQAIVWKPFTA